MTAPWSTQPITGAQHAAWMAEEWRNAGYPVWVEVVPFSTLRLSVDAHGEAVLVATVMADAAERFLIS